MQLTKTFPIALLTLALLPQLEAHVSTTHVEDNGLPTPAKTKIEAAKKAVEADPDNAAAYPRLAMAYAARARESADGAYYSKAMDAVRKSLELEPDNYPARKAEAWLTLGRHEFQKALKLTRALSKRNGDDPMVHAMRTDAAIETGHYAEAETSAQWALDMDPGGSPGLTRAAYLREHFGDFDGAIEMMKLAFNRTLPTDTEDKAWLLTHIGHLFLLKNELDAAENAHLEALKLFPDYHYALANLAEVRSAQGKHEEALELHRKHYEVAPHSLSLYGLAHAMQRAGNESEANKAFDKFEKIALKSAAEIDNSNHELAAYYVDIANKPIEALRIAKIEMKNRQDFRTREAYAWALHANDDFQKAHEEMTKALEVGVRYPVMQYRAAVIARDAGDLESAKRLFQASLDQSPGSDVSEAAAEALESL